MGAITPEERAAVRARSPVGAQVRHAGESRVGVRDPEPANGSTDAPAAGPSDAPRSPAPAPERARAGAEARAGQAGPRQAVSDILWGTKRRQGMVEAMAKQAARTVGSQIGRQILRGVLGGILGGIAEIVRRSSGSASRCFRP